MREAITAKLMLLPAFGGRVYDPHAAGAATEKPYLVVTLQENSDPAPWAAYSQVLEVAVVGPRTQFVDLDALCSLVEQALHLVPLTDTAGGTYTCALTGRGGDESDEEWDVIWRPLRFEVFGILPLGSPDPGPHDPWVEAMVAWTRMLPAFAGWAVYASRWGTGPQIPAILWRVDDTTAVPDTTVGLLVTKKLIAHVRGYGFTQQTTAAVSLVAAMADARKIVLDAAERRYLTVADPRYDSRQDPAKQGQVSVSLSRRVLRSDVDRELAPLIEHVILSINGWRPRAYSEIITVAEPDGEHAITDAGGVILTRQ